MGSPLFPSGAFSRDEKKEVMGRNLVVIADYRDNVEP
jgi:hypothetical protein